MCPEVTYETKNTGGDAQPYFCADLFSTFDRRYVRVLSVYSLTTEALLDYIA